MFARENKTISTLNVCWTTVNVVMANTASRRRYIPGEPQVGELHVGNRRPMSYVRRCTKVWRTPHLLITLFRIASGKQTFVDVLFRLMAIGAIAQKVSDDYRQKVVLLFIILWLWVTRNCFSSCVSTLNTFRIGLCHLSAKFCVWKSMMAAERSSFPLTFKELINYLTFISTYYILQLRFLHLEIFSTLTYEK